MIHELTYSIISHLKSQVPELTDIVWIYDGISLTSKIKPFGTVEQMQPNIEVITKAREYFETTYRFQVGLHAKSIAERSKLQEKIKNALLNPNIALLDTSQPLPPPAVGFFYCDVPAVTPIPVEDISNDTNKHRLYFDVEVYIQRKNGVTELAKFEQ